MQIGTRPGGRCAKRSANADRLFLCCPQKRQIDSSGELDDRQIRRLTSFDDCLHGEVCRGLGISEQSYYRWRNEYGGLKLEQARRMKELGKENGRLKKAVAELTLDKQILKEALEGNF